MDATELLVLYCAKTKYDQETNDNKKSLSQILDGSIDWQRFVARVSRHGLLPSAHQIIEDRPENDRVPQIVREQLYQGYMQELARALMLNRELECILGQFCKENISVMVLKGPYLSEKIYAQKNTRTYCDIDLLTKEANVPQASLMLQQLGYEPCPERARFWWEKSYPELVLVNPSNGSLCEIHWNILDKKRFLLSADGISDAIWERAKEIQLSGCSVSCMAPEHLLIHLCLHMAIIHRFGKLILYRDLVEVLAFFNTSLDWSYFIDCVSTWQIKSQVYYPLYFAKELLGAEISEHILEEIRPKYLSARLFETIFKKIDPVSLPQYSIVDALFLALRDEKTQRYLSTLGLPYRAFRWYLKGNTC